MQAPSEILSLLNQHFKWEGAKFDIQDGIVNVTGTILLNSPLKRLPVKFGRVEGSFWCMRNILTTLEGAPFLVTESFDCSGNQLSSLKGAPEVVQENFYCSDNQLESLEGGPGVVGEQYHCYNNQLTSLLGSPRKLARIFNCSNNSLRTLEGAPMSVEDFLCFDNRLQNLRGLPGEITGKLDVSYNSFLSSLEGLDTQTPEEISLSWNPSMPLLRVLLAKKISFWPEPLSRGKKLLEILNQYMGQGRAGAFDCRRELRAAGFEENARW